MWKAQKWKFFAGRNVCWRRNAPSSYAKCTAPKITGSCWESSRASAMPANPSMNNMFWRCRRETPESLLVVTSGRACVLAGAAQPPQFLLGSKTFLRDLAVDAGILGGPVVQSKQQEGCRDNDCHSAQPEQNTLLSNLEERCSPAPASSILGGKINRQRCGYSTFRQPDVVHFQSFT